MTNDEIINIVNNSTLWKDNMGRVIGLFLMGDPSPNHLYKSTNSLHFSDESWVLRFNSDENIYQRFERDTRRSIDINKDDFIHYLTIFIEMDKLRQERVRLRKIVYSGDIREYRRNKILGDII